MAAQKLNDSPGNRSQMISKCVEETSSTQALSTWKCPWCCYHILTSSTCDLALNWCAAIKIQDQSTCSLTYKLSSCQQASNVYQCLNFFSDFNPKLFLQTTFMQYDADRSGTVEPHELHAALSAFGKSFVFSHAWIHVHTSYAKHLYEWYCISWITPWITCIINNYSTSVRWIWDDR